MMKLHGNSSKSCMDLNILILTSFKNLNINYHKNLSYDLKERVEAYLQIVPAFISKIYVRWPSLDKNAINQ